MGGRDWSSCLRSFLNVDLSSIDVYGFLDQCLRWTYAVKFIWSTSESSLSSISWIRMTLLPFFLSEIYILLQCHCRNRMIKIVNWSGLLISRITMTLLCIMMYVIFTFFYDVIVELEWYKLVHWSGFCKWHALLQRTYYTS